MPPTKVAKLLARIMGVLILLLGLAAFVSNPIIGDVGYFRTDVFLNSVIVLFGLVLLLFSTKGEGLAATGLYFVGMAAFALAIIGHVYLSDYPSGGVVKLFDSVTCNPEDVWLLGGMAVVLTMCGMFNTSSRQIVRD